MSITIDGGAGITFPDTVQQTNGMTMTGGTPRYYAARAWVTFDGSTTPPTILSASNVASVSRGSTGEFTVTFTTAMPNINYSVSGLSFTDVSNRISIMSLIETAPTVNSFTVKISRIIADSAGPTIVPENAKRVSLAVFA